jgi:hypothetical protein
MHQMIELVTELFDTRMKENSESQSIRKFTDNLN